MSGNSANGRCCAVKICKNNVGKISRWNKSVCNIHNLAHEECPCLIPYGMHVFPKDPESRSIWIAALGRKTEYLPSKYARVCSVHFKDGRPTTGNPHPTELLGLKENTNENETSTEENLEIKAPSRMSKSLSVRESPISVKRSRTEAGEVLNTISKKVDSKEDDKFDIIGKNIANKLRDLPEDVALVADKFMSDILFEAAIGNISRFTKINIYDGRNEQF